MTAPNDAEDTPVRRSILRNLSNTGFTVNIARFEMNCQLQKIFCVNLQISE